MLIKGIMTHVFSNKEANAIKRELSNAKHLKNVSNKPILRGDQTITINNHQYNRDEFDNAVTGNVTKLSQFNYKLIVFHDGKTDDFDVITPNEITIENDTNVATYQFTPAKGTDR